MEKYFSYLEPNIFVVLKTMRNSIIIKQ